MTSRPYSPRIADAELQRKLLAAGGVLVEGAKACGKTATARQVAASEVLLDIDANARAAAALNPALVLNGPTPRLIDEWQVEPAIFDHVRRAIDDRDADGQFILVGSAKPADESTRHSGTGRFSRLHMRPMSLYESGVSTGAVSLQALLNGEPAGADESRLSVPDLAEEIARGGWPGSRRRDLAPALEAVRSYIDEIRRTDISTLDGTRRDPEKVLRVMQSLARNVATTVAGTTIAADAGGSDGALHNDTVADYMTALRRVFVVEDQPAWAPHMRSRYPLRQAAKRHFVDPSLAVAVKGVGPEPLLGDLNYLGHLFESLVARDLRIYAQPIDGQVSHYRDSSDLEIAAIVSTVDGRWAAFEVKLGTNMIEEAAASLIKFKERIDTAKSGEPRALAVIVGNGYAYARDDGVHVIPIGTLGP